MPPASSAASPAASSVTTAASAPAAPTVVTAAQRRFVSWAVDILIGVVVLNLFIEYFPDVIAESFLLSMLTAVLLKVMLVVIGRLEHRVSAYFKRRSGTAAKVLRVLAVWAILFVSKFVILEAVALIFRGSVQLGGFLEVVALIIALMVAEGLVWAVYRRIGRRAEAGGAAPHAGGDA